MNSGDFDIVGGGGIALDGDARVLRTDDSPIEGLYAAGTTTGGLEGGSSAGYVGGLSKSAITAFLAAEHAAGKEKTFSREASASDRDSHPDRGRYR
jgi:predicted oxidoreductase